MRGGHCLRTYSVTQKHITLSSGEAELMALVRAASEAIGLTQLAEGWGMSLEAHVFADSSAALAVTCRKGCGKLRHVRIGHLWVQEAAEQGTVRFCKVRGCVNPADILTKYLPASRLADLTALLNQGVMEGSSADCGLSGEPAQRPRRGVRLSLSPAR